MMNAKFIFIVLAIAISATTAFAQPGRFERGGKREVMRDLGLSQEQLQQIRTINRETRPLKQEAGRGLHEARKELSDAIYSDSVNEKLVQNKIQSVIEARAEITKINAMHELKVRQVLTAEQLVRFRKMRKKFAQRKRRGKPGKRRQRRNRPDRQQPPAPEL